jgi:hypothetical protein
VKAIVVVPHPRWAARNAAAYALATKSAMPIERSCLILGGDTDLPADLPPLPTTWINDPALASMDDATRGYVIAEFVRGQAADIVIMGELVDDEGLGLLPALVAHHANFTLFSQVTAMAGVAHDPDQLVVEVLAGGGKAQLAVHPPVVLAATGEASSPAPQAPPTLSRITLDSLNLDPTKLIARPPHLGDREPPAPRAASVPGNALRSLWRY